MLPENRSIISELSVKFEAQPAARVATVFAQLRTLKPDGSLQKFGLDARINLYP